MFQQVGVGIVTAIKIRREGIFVELTGALGEELVGRPAQPCGNDYGLYIPIDVDDTVIYVCPEGDPGDGVWVIGRFFEEAEKVPQQIVDAGDTAEQWVAKEQRQLVLQTRKGNLRLNVKVDGGSSQIQVADEGTISAVPASGKQVQLGSATASELDYVALYTQLKADFDAFVSAYNGHVHLAGSLANMGGPVVGSTASTLSTANSLGAQVKSSNVVAKK